MIGNKKHFLIAGATGLVGKALLDMLLENDAVGKVTILVRRPIELDHPKLSVKEIDFEMFTEREIAPNVDAVFCCLGTTMAQAGGKDAFRRVDYEHVVKLAVYSQRQKIPQFHAISAVGANPNSKIFYNKVKGRMELEVSKLDKIRSIYFYRPSMLLGNREGFRFGESLGKIFMRAFSFLIPKSGKAVHASEVALSMLSHAFDSKKGIHFIKNAEILQISR
ncbi:MAG: NAD(P)H-binding protein [Flavobacteriales bacterium]